MTKEKISNLKHNAVELLKVIFAVLIICVFLNMGYMLMFRKSILEQSHVTLLLHWIDGLFYLALLAGVWLYKSAVPSLVSIIQMIATRGSSTVSSIKIEETEWKE